MVRAGVRLLLHAGTIVTIAGLSMARAQAQVEAEAPAQAQAPARGNFGNGLLIGVNYGTPLRGAFSGGVFIHSRDLGNEGAVGTIAGGSVGRGGMEVWGGRKAVALGGGDYRAVLTRTWNGPRGGASPNSTYLGGEVAFGGLIGRLSVGYARQIAGPGARRDHVITWGVGIEIAPHWGTQVGGGSQDPPRRAHQR